MAIIIVLIIRNLDNGNVIRVLTLALDSGDGDIVVAIRVRFILRGLAEVFSLDPGGQIAIFDGLAFKQLPNKETSLGQVSS